MKLFSTQSSTTSRIVKALSIFGSVQALMILTSAIRVKVIAVLIGPVGVGIYSIFWQTMDLLRNVGGLNISTPAVAEISALRSKPNDADQRVRHVRRLGAALGLITTIIAALAAPLLSKIMFGNASYTLWFAALSPMVALLIVGSVNNAVMQAQERLRPLALSTLWSAMLSSLCTVVFIWIWGLRGIVPALLLLGVIQYVFSCIYSSRRISFSFGWRKVRTTFARSRSLLSMGSYLTVTMAFTMLCSYAFTIYLNRVYDTDIVGVYQAGYTMLNAYAGAFFVAITMEYYPRLARQGRYPMAISAVVNQELRIILRILIPLVVVFVAVAWLLVRILYTKQFEGAVPYVMFGAPGLLFRAVSTALAYTILAKRDGKIYIWTEISSSLIGLGLNIAGYEMYGFAGVGIAYTLWYASYTATTFVVYRWRYGCVLRSSVWKALGWGVVAVSAAVGAMLFILPAMTGR